MKKFSQVFSIVDIAASAMDVQMASSVVLSSNPRDLNRALKLLR